MNAQGESLHESRMRGKPYVQSDEGRGCALVLAYPAYSTRAPARNPPVVRDARCGVEQVLFFCLTQHVWMLFIESTAPSPSLAAILSQGDD